MWKIGMEQYTALELFVLSSLVLFRWHLGDYEEHDFFSIWRPVREETLIFVCSFGCLVELVKKTVYKSGTTPMEEDDAGPSPAS